MMEQQLGEMSGIQIVFFFNFVFNLVFYLVFCLFVALQVLPKGEQRKPPMVVVSGR